MILRVWLLILTACLWACGGDDDDDDAAGDGDADADADGDGDGDGDGYGDGDGDGDADGDGDGDADADADGDGDADHQHGTGTVSGHIHSIQRWGDAGEIALGTHEGVHRTEAGQDSLVVLATEGDFMGFVQNPFDPDVYWGSGHWGAGGFPNWGFIESIDGGVTWEEISLSGDADFHEMDASPDEEGLVAGSFDGAIWVSRNAGRDWDSYDFPAAHTSLLVEEPAGPTLLVSSSDGIDRVTVPDLEVEHVLDGDVTGVGRWTNGWAYGTADGALHLCAPDLAACEDAAGPGDSVLVFLASPDDPDTFWVLTDQSDVFHTHDRGATWVWLAGH